MLEYYIQSMQQLDMIQLLPDTIPFGVCILPLVDEILPVVVVMVPPAVSPEALLLLIPLNA